MKKLLALVFVAGLAFVGCGDDKNKGTDSKKDTRAGKSRAKSRCYACATRGDFGVYKA